MDDMLRRKLQGMGAVLLQGAKWCGKTTTAEQLAQSVLYFSDQNKKEHYLRMADINASELLKGTYPRLLDEWQLAPQLWDAVRFHVDHSEGCNQFILIGSAVPPKTDVISHTGTGRIARMTMRPMSLWESRESSGSVSFEDLFASHELPGMMESTKSLKEIAFLACRGGWPLAVRQNKEIALDRAFDYYDAIVSTDITRVDDTLRNPDRVRHFMRSYSRLQGTSAAMTVIRDDMKANDTASLNEDTVASYHKALKKIFVIDDLPAWSPNLRNKTTIRTTDTRFYSDPSIATASLGLGPNDLLNDLTTFGFIFECAAIRDLRCYAEALFGNVYHYHDSRGLECDAIIHLRNGNYGLIEIKLGGERLIEEGAQTLLALEANLDFTKIPRPSFKMILIATGPYAYQRKDGIIVCPIDCLKN